jgi:hypothetical protein
VEGIACDQVNSRLTRLTGTEQNYVRRPHGRQNATIVSDYGVEECAKELNHASAKLDMAAVPLRGPSKHRIVAASVPTV